MQHLPGLDVAADHAPVFLQQHLVIDQRHHGQQAGGGQHQQVAQGAQRSLGFAGVGKTASGS